MIGTGREAFELPEDVVWLNTAHQGPLPRRAADAARRAVGRKLDPTRMRDQEFFDAPERLRRSLADLLGCPPSEVALGDSATHGLHVLATNLELSEGDEVLLLRDDFPATLTPWLPLRRKGVRIRWLPRRRGLAAEAVAAALRDRTRVFCVTWVDSFSGDVLDVEAVGQACREAEVTFVLNATQGLGVRPLPVSDVPVDAVTCAGYKWLLGPYGTGFCWLSAATTDLLAGDRWYWLHGARRHGLRNLARVVSVPPPADASRHDAFGSASFFNVLPWIEAVRYVLEIGPERAADHNRALVALLRELLLEAGHGTPVTAEDEDTPFLVFRPMTDPARLVRRLREEGIHVALRGRTLRVAPHLHNDEDDIRRLGHALRAA